MHDVRYERLSKIWTWTNVCFWYFVFFCLLYSHTTWRISMKLKLYFYQKMYRFETSVIGYIFQRPLDGSIVYRHPPYCYTEYTHLKVVFLYMFNVTFYSTLQWRHQPQHCLLNRLFRHRSRKTSKLRVTGLCAGNSAVIGEFPAQRDSNAENVSIWWRRHDYQS